MSSARKRKNIVGGNKGRAVFRPESEGDSKEARHEALSSTEQQYPGWLMCISCVAGVIAMVYCSYLHSWFMYTLHENNMWFTNIKEVEREISFRTESGLYYSYYKQVVQAPSLSQGVQELMSDRLTEYPDTINILERMNVYQEVILAAIYKLLPASWQEDPIMFYIKSVFALHGMLVAALFVLTWILANSWLAGGLAAALYMFNRLDTTRVEYTIPLRESFALPFLWVQAVALTIYFRPSTQGWKQRLSVVVAGVSTFLFCLFWQFNQFIMLLQAFALFGVWVLDILPPRKVMVVYGVQAVSMLAVCALQFVNTMILGSLVLSFIPATLILMAVRGEPRMGGHWLLHGGKVVMYSVAVLVLMVGINTGMKVLLQVEADEHIFKFLQNKFSGEETRDFDSRLYLCLSIFGFLTWDVYQRLTQGFVLPIYIFAHLVFLLLILLDVIKLWRSYAEDGEKESGEETTDQGTANDSVSAETKAQGLRKSKREPKTESWTLIKSRPELVFHIVQCTFFGVLAMTTLRMKYLWTPYMCVLAALLVTDRQVWRAGLKLVKMTGAGTVDAWRHAAVVLALAVLITTKLPGVKKDLEELREFWDPDTVQLMEWIQQNTEPMASFSGSMQLMAGVKLCTGRPVNNHPHYEDKLLRHKTKQLYQVYGRRTPEDVHAILKSLGSHYIILEDSICLAPLKNNCRTPDLIDLDNGVLPDGNEPMEGLKRSSVPRFCDEVRHQSPSFTKFFREVFINKTFRIYKVL
ncbi:protein C-mannosyl-transferase DPY19L3-like [Babylonia areolata]|uniref:protein C-mannosyl-transferase DPY19L3-like n=1 Tax=Babylonia areolata TaxID=304850 RepID=UPI003FD2576B